MLTSLSKSLSKFKPGKVKLFETSYWYAKIKPELEIFLENLTKGISKNLVDIQINLKSNSQSQIFEINIISFDQTLTSFLKTEQNDIKNFLEHLIYNKIGENQKNKNLGIQIDLSFTSKAKRLSIDN